MGAGVVHARKQVAATTSLCVTCAVGWRASGWHSLETMYGCFRTPRCATGGVDSFGCCFSGWGMGATPAHSTFASPLHTSRLFSLNALVSDHGINHHIPYSCGSDRRDPLCAPRSEAQRFVVHVGDGGRKGQGRCSRHRAARVPGEGHARAQRRRGRGGRCRPPLRPPLDGRRARPQRCLFWITNSRITTNNSSSTARDLPHAAQPPADGDHHPGARLRDGDLPSFVIVPVHVLLVPHGSPPVLR